MSETLKVIERVQAARSAAKKAKAAGRAVAGDKRGARKAGVLGAVPFVPLAAGGAKKGTEGAATAGSLAGAKAGSIAGSAVGGPVGFVVGGAVGGGLGAAASQSDKVRKAVKSVQDSKAGKKVSKTVDAAAKTKAGKATTKVYKGAKGAVSSRYKSLASKVKQKSQNLKSDVRAGVLAAGGSAAANDLSRLTGGKTRRSKIRDFRRGMKANKALREGTRDVESIRKALGKKKS